MVVELKQRALLAVVLLLLPAAWACDSNTAAPTKTELTYGSVATNNGVTFIGGSGVALTCTVGNAAVPGANPIPPLSDPVRPFNNPIPVLVSSTQSVAAMAIVSPASISLNPGFMHSLLPPVQAFLFFRECGRFNVTHAAGPALFTGTTCWSVRRLQQMNMFGPSERTAIQRFLELTFPFATATVPSGVQQWATIGSCL
jgi:hypothetical protein